MLKEKPDKIIEFMNSISPRIGPMNAVNLMKDAHLGAFRQLFIELGVAEKHVDEMIESHLTKTAQNILNMPVQSPIQRV